MGSKTFNRGLVNKERVILHFIATNVEQRDVYRAGTDVDKKMEVRTALCGMNIRRDLANELGEGLNARAETQVAFDFASFNTFEGVSGRRKGNREG